MRRSTQRDEAFVDFVESAQAELLRAAYFLTGSTHAAHDLVQDTLVRTYLAWPRIRPGTAYAYARRILVNQRVDTWRKSSRETLTDAPGDRAVVEDCRSEDRDELVRLLAELPEQQRKVVVLRYYADLSERETAEALGISLGTVKSTASRGLAALRELAPDPERSMR